MSVLSGGWCNSTPPASFSALHNLSDRTSFRLVQLQKGPFSFTRDLRSVPQRLNRKATDYAPEEPREFAYEVCNMTDAEYTILLSFKGREMYQKNEQAIGKICNPTPS